MERIGNKFYWKENEIGILYGERFVTHRDKTTFFRKVGGFCFNRELVMSLPKKTKIMVIYHGDVGEEVFIVSRVNLIRKSKFYHETGYEPQLGLNIKDFDTHLK